MLKNTVGCLGINTYILFMIIFSKYFVNGSQGIEF